MVPVLTPPSGAEEDGRQPPGRAAGPGPDLVGPDLSTDPKDTTITGEPRGDQV